MAKTVGDLTESELRAIVQNILDEVIEGNAYGSSSDIVQGVEKILSAAGLDIEAEPDDVGEDE